MLLGKIISAIVLSFNWLHIYYQDLGVLPIYLVWLEYVQIRTNTGGIRYVTILYGYDYDTITLRYGYVTIRYDTIRGAIQYNTIRIRYEYVRIRRKKGKRYLLASEESLYICDEMSPK